MTLGKVLKIKLNDDEDDDDEEEDDDDGSISKKQKLFHRYARLCSCHNDHTNSFNAPSCATHFLSTCVNIRCNLLSGGQVFRSRNLVLC